MRDLTEVFYPAAQRPFSPYSVDAFLTPPWVALLIAPLSFLPLWFVRVLAPLLNLLFTGLVVLKYGGSGSSLLITMTSYPFLFLLGTGSVEWIPMLGLLLRSPILMLSKPQSGMLALLIWLERADHKLRFLLSIVVFLGLSLLIWPGWPLAMLENFRTLPADFASPLNKIMLWPWSIPFGLIALYYAMLRKDEMLAVIATWLLTPHLIYHSLTMGMAMIAARFPRLALAMSVGLYIVAALRWQFA